MNKGYAYLKLQIICMFVMRILCIFKNAFGLCIFGNEKFLHVFLCSVIMQ